MRSWIAASGSLLLSAGLVLLLLAATDLPRESAYMTGIFLLAALLWVSEAVPLAATALIVILLQIILLANPGQWPGLGFEAGPGMTMRGILNAAFDPVVVLFFGGLLLAQAAIEEGVDRAMAGLILRPFGHHPWAVLLGLMAVTAIFSMWMSNTATTAMMIAIVAPMVAQLPAGDRFRTALVLAIPVGANLGGLGTPIGSPPNAVAVGYLQAAGLQVGFLQWMLIAVPLMILLMGAAWVMLWLIFPPGQKDLRVMLERRPVTRRGMVVVIVFVITALLWLTEAWHGLPAAMVALLPPVVFMSSGFIRREQIKRLDWDILILIAGGITLGAGMQGTGLDNTIVGLLPEAAGANIRWITAALVIATLLLSIFMSNTAAANLLLPIGISFATAAALNGDGLPIVIALSIALVSSTAMVLPVSTPPNAIAYARGDIATRDMAIIGLMIAVLAVVLILAFGPMIIMFWYGGA